jgi:hypothetical protein
MRECEIPITQGHSYGGAMQQVFNSVPALLSRANRLRSIALLSACAALFACDGPEDYVIKVDDIQIAAPATPTGQARITYVGTIGNNGCSQLLRVERQTLPSDTLQLRFIGRYENLNCTQMPEPLAYVETLANTPARTVHIKVLQPGGAPLNRTVTLPLTTTP